MPDTTPTTELRAAAALLRSHATTAHRSSPAPWTVTDEHVVRCADNMIVADRSDTDHPAERADLPYIATMGPGVGLALADWLDAAATDAVPCRCESCPTQAALVVARLVLGTTDQQPTTADPLAEVWTVWHEDESVWAHFATVDAARQGTIDCWQEDEPVCPDYSWRQDGPRLELIVGGEHSGVYASCHRVYGGPAPAPAAPVDRAAVLREAADEADRAGGLYAGHGDYNRAGAAFALMETYRRMAVEEQPATDQPTKTAGPCPHCRHISCRDRTPCNAILSATALDLARCRCTGQPAADQPDTETEAAK